MRVIKENREGQQETGGWEMKHELGQHILNISSASDSVSSWKEEGEEEEEEER